MRIAAADVVWIGQAEFGEQGTCAAFGVAAAEFALADGGFDHLVHDAFGGVEAGGGRLRHIGDFGAAQVAQIADAALQDVAPVDPDFAACDLDAAATVAHGAEADGGFACAGFADEAEDFALLQIEAHTVDDFDFLWSLIGRVDGCADFQVAHFEKWIAHYPRPPLREVVRLSTQSATRFTEMASVAMAKAGINAAGMP
jgi:hypothetical protein